MAAQRQEVVRCFPRFRSEWTRLRKLHHARPTRRRIDAVARGSTELWKRRAERLRRTGGALEQESFPQRVSRARSEAGLEITGSPSQICDTKAMQIRSGNGFPPPISARIGRAHSLGRVAWVPSDLSPLIEPTSRENRLPEKKYKIKILRRRMNSARRIPTNLKATFSKIRNWDDLETAAAALAAPPPPPSPEEDHHRAGFEPNSAQQQSSRNSTRPAKGSAAFAPPPPPLSLFSLSLSTLSLYTLSLSLHTPKP